MGVLPNTRIARIEWFEQRLAAWLANAAAIGLTPAQVTQLQGEIAAARVAYNGSQQARADSKSATVGFYADEDTMSADGRDLIKTIKAFAETTGDPNVYVLANVPPPSEPVPLGPPGTPYDLTTTLNNAGHLKLTWKADDSASRTGVYFMVQRRLDGDPDFTIVGGSGGKDFTDVKVPLGTASATYMVTGFRGEIAGEPSNQVTVQFGVNVPGPGEESSGEGGLTIAA